MKKECLEYLQMHLSQDGYFFALNPEYPSISRLVEIGLGRSDPPDVYFKKKRRRIVMRYNDVVVKRFEFNTVADVLHSYRYAPREVQYYYDFVKAFGSLEGFRLPKLLAYFEKKCWWKFHYVNGIIMEYVSGAREINSSEIMLTVPLFVHLYRKCIYHSDLHFGNILFCPENKMLYPIDYNKCFFFKKPNWKALLISVAHFLDMGQIPDDMGKNFLVTILQALPELHLDQQEAWKYVSHLLSIWSKGN